MKKITLIFLFVSSLAYSVQMNVSSVRNYQDFDMKFKFKSHKRKTYAILDCQSFFQKIDFYLKGRRHSENYISIQECEWLYDQAVSCIQQESSYCLDSQDLWRSECQCK